MKMISIPEDEYRWLHTIYLVSLLIRDKGVMEFNRLPSAMRLAIVSLAQHYKERGFTDRGTPAPGTRPA